MLALLFIWLFKPIQISAEPYISKEEVTSLIEQIFQNRNRAILTGDSELIQSIYDTDTKYGTWAFEYEIRKNEVYSQLGRKTRGSVY